MIGIGMLCCCSTYLNNWQQCCNVQVRIGHTCHQQRWVYMYIFHLHHKWYQLIHRYCIYILKMEKVQIQGDQMELMKMAQTP